MNVEKRDEHLNEIIGVKPEKEKTEVAVVENPVPSTTQSTPVAIPDTSDKRNELIKSRSRMCDLSAKLDDVVNSHTDVAIEFGKARDVEAVASLAKTLVEINREIRETNKDLYSKEEDDEKDAKVVNKTQNNIILQNTDMRTLNDIISGKKKDAEEI